jgi:hypothetical protein
MRTFTSISGLSVALSSGQGKQGESNRLHFPFECLIFESNEWLVVVYSLVIVHCFECCDDALLFFDVRSVCEGSMTPKPLTPTVSLAISQCHGRLLVADGGWVPPSASLPLLSPFVVAAAAGRCAAAVALLCCRAAAL